MADVGEMDPAAAAYYKQKNWQRYVKHKAQLRAKSRLKEETKECTFRPAVRTSTRPPSPPAAPLGGMQAHVERQRRARETKELLDNYFERGSSTFGVFRPPPPPPQAARSGADGSRRRDTLAGGVPSHAASTGRLAHSGGRGAAGRLSAPTASRSHASLLDGGDVAPWGDPHTDALADARDLERQVEGERMVAERERSALLAELGGAGAGIGSPPVMPPPVAAAGVAGGGTHRSPRGGPKRRGAGTGGPGSPPRRVRGAMTSPPVPAPALGGRTAGAATAGRSPRGGGGRKARRGGKAGARGRPAVADVGHAVEFREPAAADGTTTVVQVPKLPPAMVGQMLSELTEQRLLLRSVLQAVSAAGGADGGAPSDGDGNVIADGVTRLEALHTHMGALVKALRPWLAYQPPVTPDGRVPGSPPAGGVAAAPSADAAYAAALVQQAAVCTAGDYGLDLTTLARPVTAQPQQPAGDGAVVTVGDVFAHPTDGVDVSGWVFVGGVLSGWAAVALPPPDHAAARSAADLGATGFDWAPAWIVATHDVVVAFNRGAPKGWLPLAKATLQREAVPSPVRGAASTPSTTPAGVVIPDGDDADNPPLTLICGSNMVQLQASSVPESDAWAAALSRAMELARRRIAEPEAVDPEEVEDPALEVEGIMLKRAFAPGKRGKWLRRLCRINMDTGRLEYFDCSPVGYVPLPDARVGACGTPDADDEDGLFLLRVAATSSAASEAVTSGARGSLTDYGLRTDLMLIAEAEGEQRDTWTTVVRRIAGGGSSEGTAVAVPAAGAGAGASAGAAGTAQHPAPSGDDDDDGSTWMTFKRHQGRATLQLQLASGGGGGGGGGGCNDAAATPSFQVVETRMADANALRRVQDVVVAHTDVLLRCGARVSATVDASALRDGGPPPPPSLAAHTGDEEPPDGLPRAAWKFALHHVCAALRAAPPAGGARPPLQQPLALGELAAAFAVLDALPHNDTDTITPAAVMAGAEQQRATVLSLLSQPGGTSDADAVGDGAGDGRGPPMPPTPDTAAAAEALATMPTTHPLSSAAVSPIKAARG